MLSLSLVIQGSLNVEIVVLNCQKYNQCLKYHVSAHKSLELLFEGDENLKFFRKSENFPKIWKLTQNLKIFQKCENLSEWVSEWVSDS